MKLNIGCGKTIMEGYTNIDIDPIEGAIYGDIYNLDYEDESVDLIHCDNVLEHLANPTLAIKEVINHALKCVAFHSLMFTMHSINTSIIGTQQALRLEKCDYRHSICGKLEEASLFRTMQIPHHKRFYSDSKTSFTVTIHNLPTFTLEQSIIGAVTFTHSTAVGTPFASMVGVNSCESDILVEASGFKIASEEQEGYSENLSISFPAKFTKAFQVFDSDVGIVFKCKISNVTNYFTDSVLDEITLRSIESSKRLFSFMASLICQGTELTLPNHHSLTFDPNILAEVELFENFAFGGEYTSSETLTIDINSDNILTSGNLLFRTIQEGDYLTITSQSIGLTNPPIIEQVLVSLPVAIMFEGDGNRILGVKAQSDKVLSEREGFGTSGNVELDRDTFERVPLDFGNITLNITDNLTIEGGTRFGS